VGHAHELTVVDAFNGVTGGADLAVDLEAASEGAAVVGGHEAEVFPEVGGGVEDFIVAFCGVLGVEDGEGRGGGGGGC